MMEKLGKLRSNFLTFLPKAASPVTFQLSPPLSPVKTTAGKGLSGPIISLIPKEARRKPKNGSFDAREPTSPKVSCMGKVKSNKKRNTSKPLVLVLPPTEEKEVKKKKELKIVKILKGLKQADKFDGCNKSGEQTELQGQTPSLGQMKRFASGRGVLSDFDWRGPDLHQDQETGKCEEGMEEMRPSPANEVEALQPRNEVNLWKRRTMPAPTRLQL